MITNFFVNRVISAWTKQTAPSSEKVLHQPDACCQEQRPVGRVESRGNKTDRFEVVNGDQNTFSLADLMLQKECFGKMKATKPLQKHSVIKRGTYTHKRFVKTVSVSSFIFYSLPRKKLGVSTKTVDHQRREIST